MEKEIKEARHSYLIKFYQNIGKPVTSENWIPEEVKIDYTPSGKIENQTIPILLLAGISGGIVGYLLYLILSAISLFIFKAFAEMGSCLSIIICPAGLVYILAPLAIPILAGSGVSWAGPYSKCRNSTTAIIVGVIIGILGSIASIYFANNVMEGDGLKKIDNIMDHLKADLDSIIPKMVSLVWESLFEAHKYIWFGIIGIIGLFLSVVIAQSAADTPFCEKEKLPMKEKIAQRIHLEDTPCLLLGLLELNTNYLNQVSILEKKEKDTWDKIQRLDIIFWTTKNNLSNLIEVKAFYAEIKKTEKGNKMNMKSRLIHSEWISKEESIFLSQILKFEL